MDWYRSVCYFWWKKRRLLSWSNEMGLWKWSLCWGFWNGELQRRGLRFESDKRYQGEFVGELLVWGAGSKSIWVVWRGGPRAWKQASWAVLSTLWACRQRGAHLPLPDLRSPGWPRGPEGPQPRVLDSPSQVVLLGTVPSASEWGKSGHISEPLLGDQRTCLAGFWDLSEEEDVSLGGLEGEHTGPCDGLDVGGVEGGQCWDADRFSGVGNWVAGGTTYGDSSSRGEGKEEEKCPCAKGQSSSPLSVLPSRWREQQPPVGL